MEGGLRRGWVCSRGGEKRSGVQAGEEKREVGRSEPEEWRRGERENKSCF